MVTGEKGYEVMSMGRIISRVSRRGTGLGRHKGMKGLTPGPSPPPPPSGPAGCRETRARRQAFLAKEN